MAAAAGHMGVGLHSRGYDGWLVPHGLHTQLAPSIHAQGVIFLSWNAQSDVAGQYSDLSEEQRCLAQCCLAAAPPHLRTAP